ncbi:cell division protein CrgA [Planosporangium sp. 12N6]|uniref:cell division protein CrgA n=1 Tax=Planosporangium spinosum TaxID=3402278 RepID=UPI003CF0B627
MPKSQVRKKKVYTPPVELRPQPTAATKRPSPVWVPATAVALLVLGIAWMVVFYLTQGFVDTPALLFLANIGYWNFAIGFGAMIGALILLSKWR